MFKRFEEIIEDHRIRNNKVIGVALIFFLVLFLISQFGAALLILKTSSAEKLDAIGNFELTKRHYIIASMQFLFVGWWTLSYLKFKQLRFRTALMDELIIADYKDIAKNVPDTYITWDKTEHTSILSKKAGIKIMLIMIVLIFAKDIFSLAYKSTDIIFIAGIISYEFVALRSSEVIRKFLMSIKDNYVLESKLEPPSEHTKTLKQQIIEGIIAAGLFVIISHSLLGFSFLGYILYFFIFIGLYSATIIIKGIDKYIMSVAIFADSVRWKRQRTASLEL
jgi:hypothetical protein